MYKMKALLSGSMWSVAPMSAMRRLLWPGWSLLEMNVVECAGGFWRSVMTSMGSWTVQTPFGLMDDVVWQQLVGDSDVVSRGSAVA